MDQRKKRSPRPPCEVCAKGQPHAKCKGHRRDGQPCGRSPKTGFSVCRQCGGAAPQVIAAAERRLAEASVRAALDTYGRPAAENEDAGELLLEEVRRSAGHVRWLAAVVSELQRDELVWTQRSSQHQEGALIEGHVDVTTTTSGAAVNVWIDIYQKERKHLVDACRVAIAAGLEERRVRLAEQSGEAHGMWLRAATASLGLGPEQLRQVMADGLANLHLVQGGAA